MPDDFDYAYLGGLLERPEEWTRDDLANAKAMLDNQRRAVAEAHPKDAKNRRTLQGVADALESAIARYDAR